MRVSFYEVFNDNEHGAFTPKCTVKIGGVTMTPGVTMGAGVSMGGFDVAANAGRDLEVTQHADGTVEITGAY